MKLHYQYHSFDAWLKAFHGEKIQKIPLDTRAGCPNRDGTISSNGCTFCNPQGSGSGLSLKGLNLTEQWQFWREKFAQSDRLKNTHRFIAYMQSYSNTYGSIKKLRTTLNELQSLPLIAGLAIGTRPDCIDRDKLRLLASLPFKNTWIEFGVQSMHNTTLKHICRGHDVQCSIDAIMLAHEYGLKICVHLMAGLPHESPKDFLESVRKICTLPINGIKLHGLYVCHQTPLAQDFTVGNYVPMEMDTYVDLICDVLAIIPSHIIIHRLTSDPAEGELIAPKWASQKGHVVRSIDHLLQLQGRWQGCEADVPNSNPYQQNKGVPEHT